MDLGIDNSYVMYTAGIFLSVVTLLYFGASFIFRLSPATKAALLGFSPVILFVFAVSISKKLIDTVFYVLSAASYMVFLGYSLLKFSPGESVVLFSLAASSAILIGAGYVVSERELELDWVRGKKIVAGVFLLSVLLVGVDVSGSQPVYSLELNDTVRISSEPGTSVGALEARNDFVLPRELELPRYEGCLYTPERHSVYVDRENPERGIIEGSTVKRFKLSIDRVPRNEEEVDVEDVYEVRQMGECPDSISEKKLVIVEQEPYD